MAGAKRIPRILRIGLPVVAYLLVPLYLSEYLLYLVTLMTITAIVVQGLNVMIGYGGLFNLGQAGFMAFGAYFGAIVSSELTWLPFPVIILLAGIGASLLGLLIGFPCLRLRGFFLAIATFGFSGVIFELIIYFSSLTGGNDGMYAPPPSLGGARLSATWELFIIAAVLLLIGQFVVSKVVRSKTGRAWNAIRDGEIAASSMGIDLRKYRLAGFAFGAFYGGVAGVLYAYAIGFLRPDFFSGTLGLSFLLTMVVGGLGTVWGPVIGSIIISSIPQILGGAFSQHMHLVYGVVLVLFTLFVPKGVVGLWKRVQGNAAGGYDIRAQLVQMLGGKQRPAAQKEGQTR